MLIAVGLHNTSALPGFGTGCKTIVLKVVYGKIFYSLLIYKASKWFLLHVLGRGRCYGMGHCFHCDGKLVME